VSCVPQPDSDSDTSLHGLQSVPSSLRETPVRPNGAAGGASSPGGPRTAVLGAGPAGLSVAYELSRQGLPVDVYEKDDAPGGLARSIPLWGQRVELGPHYLLETADPGMNALLRDAMGSVSLHRYLRRTSIYVGGRHLAYPPSATSLLKALGPWKSFRAAVSWLGQWARPREDSRSVEAYISQRVGPYLYRRLFRDYSEKLWGTPCRTLDESYGRSLIGFGARSLAATLRKYLLPGRAHPHARCLYPEGGMSVLWDGMTRRIREQGGQVHFGARVARLVRDDRGIQGLCLEDGSTRSYDRIVSTIPESVLLRLLPDTPAPLIARMDGVPCRSLLSVFCRAGSREYLRHHSVFLYGPELQAARITNFNAFRGAPGNDILLLEYWTDEAGELWTASDARIRQVAGQDLGRLSGVGAAVLDQVKVMRLRKAYQIPFPGLADIKGEVADHLRGVAGLHPIGRAHQALFNYGMADALAEGLSLGRQLCRSSPGVR
jgi:protoporphyrinogen oxidase